MKTIKGHQGDVYFQSAKLPQGAIKTENKPLATGTTHVHVVTGDVDRYELGDRVFFSVRKGILQHLSSGTPEVMKSEIILPHADHLPHSLPAGIYEFVIQREYNPYAKIFEQVRD